MRLVPPVLPSSPSSRVSPASAPELMDDPACDAVELAGALDALSAANRWLGGLSAVARPLERALAGRPPGPIDLLDVGTGSGDIPRALGRRLRAAGWSPRFCLTDNHAATLRIARRRARHPVRPGLGPSVGDGAGETWFVRLAAPRLPFSTGAFDVALAGTMLHHLETPAAAAFLRELDRVSRLGWVVADLRRGLPGRLAIHLLGATIWRRNTTARIDGRTSIRRAFAAREVEELLEEAGLPDAVVRRGPFRWVAVGGELARS